MRRHLEAYMQRTKDIRTGPQLLLSYVQQHVRVARQTGSRWLKAVLAGVGIDPQQFATHPTRAASCSAVANIRVALTTIMKAAGRSNK